MKLLANAVPLSGAFVGYCGWLVIALLFGSVTFAQEVEYDSINGYHLNEVVIINDPKQLHHDKLQKPLGNLDEFLESSKSINMIKRGAYAWEATMNTFTSERLSITIDGMQIFGACTDKMDPTTSYVEISNLKRVEIASSQQGAVFGNSIGGAINMVLDRSGFTSNGVSGSLKSSYETNSNSRIAGGELNFSTSKFYLDGDILYRKADNYFAGRRHEMDYSQYEKYNFSIGSGYHLGKGKSVHANLIVDQAYDVGYPALTMDVLLARAIIASVSFKQDTLLSKFSNWETKFYYNDITHVMDDTKRPEVSIHMDMPGCSETIGFYSQAKFKAAAHELFIKADGFYNTSLAEMTMYPTNDEEPLMFMLTWPDVRTTTTGVYVEDLLTFQESALKLSTRIAYHRNEIPDDFGLNSLRIFYPTVKSSQNRVLKSFSAQFDQRWKSLHFNGGLSYGERAPSVSEGFGFYLFNSFDKYDYIGNPELVTEQSFDVNAEISIKKGKYEISAQATFFRVSNFILAKIDSDLSAMTIGANGVKIYDNLNYANLTNVSLNGKLQISPKFSFSGLVSYHRGVDQDGENLPIISPFSYRTSLDYKRKVTTASLSLSGAAKQVNYNSEYGESPTSEYVILNASLGRRFITKNNTILTNIGIENILDTYYSTYSDWNKIPRMGRNIYLTINYLFK